MFKSDTWSSEDTIPLVTSPKEQQGGIVLYDVNEEMQLENHFQGNDSFKSSTSEITARSFTSYVPKIYKDQKGIYHHATKVHGYNGSILMYPCIITNSKHPGQSILENVHEYESKFIVAKEFKGSEYNYYLYSAFHDVTDFYRFLNELSQSEWNFHECFGSGKRKLFFDIDISRETFNKQNDWLLTVVDSLFSEEYANIVRDDLVKNILGFFLSCGHVLNLDSDILMFSSHGKDKYSFHIIIDNYTVENNIQAAEITKKILEVVNQEYLKYIDAGVNKSRQLLRIYLNCKPETGRYKILQRNWSYFGNPVTLKFNTKGDIRWQVTDFKTEEEKKRFFQKLELDKSFISLFRVEPIKINYQIPVKEALTDPIYYQEIGDIDLDRIVPVLPEGFELSDLNGWYIRLKRAPDTICPICNRAHEHDNNTLFISGPDQRVFFCCFRANDDPTILTKSKLLIILKPELTNTNQDSKSKKVRANKVYNKKHCERLPVLVNFIVLVCSYLGTGKTVSFINFIRLVRAARVLILSPRRLYAISIANEYNKSGNGDWLLPFDGQSFECYLNHVDISQLNRLTLQLESIHKLNNVQPFDCVIIDEIEGIKKQFSSPTMQHQIRCAEMFEKVIKETKYVIGGDAFLKSKTCQFLQCIKPIHVIRNDYPAPRRKAIRYKKYYHLTHQLEKHLTEGKRVVFVCASKQKAREFAQKLESQGISYKIYTGLSDNAQEDLEDLSRVTVSWMNVQCLIYTSTITVGVNYDIPDNYDLLYVYGSSYASTVTDIFQGMLRVRHIKENTMHYYIYDKPVNKSLPTKFNDVARYVSNLKNDIESLTKKHLAVTKLHIKKDIEIELSIAVQWNQAPEWLKLCHILNVQETNQSRVYYKRVFDDYLERCGYVVEDFKITNTFKAELFEDLEEDFSCDLGVRDYFYHEVPDINDESYEDLKFKITKGIANKIDVQMIDKYKLKKKLKDDTSEEIIAKIYNKYFHPSDRIKHKFYNVWIEKTKSVGDLINQELPEKYIECASARIVKLELIQAMNFIIGIKNSCEPFEFPETVYDQSATRLNQLIPHIDRYFEFTSDAKNPYEIMSKRLIKVYNNWCGVTIGRVRHRPTINGKRVDQYTIKSEGDQTLFDVIKY